MRAAKYDALHAASSTRPAARAGAEPAPRAAKAPARSRAKSVSTPAPGPVADDAAEPETCGHRSMAGKLCKRPAGHPETNHRYT